MAPLGLGMGIIWDEFPGGIALDTFKGLFNSTQSGVSGFRVTPGWSGVSKANGDVIRITFEMYFDGTWAETYFSDSIGVTALISGESQAVSPAFTAGFGVTTYDKSVTSDGSYGDYFDIRFSSGDEPSAGAAFYARNMLTTITSSGGSTGDKFNKTFDFSVGGSDLSLFADLSGTEGSITKTVGNVWPG
jgi:hypothetical protein